MGFDITIIDGFEWDHGNAEKSFTIHSIHYKEAEQAFFNSPLIIKDDKKHSSNEARYHCLGMSDEKKLLFISFTIRNNKIRIISARPQHKKEKIQYEKF